MQLIEHLEIFEEIDGQYQYTESRVVYKSNGQIYHARSELRLQDRAKITFEGLTDNTLVPIDAYAPLIVSPLTTLDPVPGDSYVKRPRYDSYDSKYPHRISDSFLAEAKICHLLQRSPHQSLGRYLGCQVENGRITGLCFEGYSQTLMDRVNPKHHMKRACSGSGWTADECDRIIRKIEEGLRHLHSLGVVHNDINPANIMFDADDNPVIIDFGSCLPIGRSLEAGGRTYEWYDENVETSLPSNDMDALAEIREWMSDRPVKNFKFKE